MVVDEMKVAVLSLIFLVSACVAPEVVVSDDDAERISRSYIAIPDLSQFYWLNEVFLSNKTTYNVTFDRVEDKNLTLLEYNNQKFVAYKAFEYTENQETVTSYNVQKIDEQDLYDLAFGGFTSLRTITCVNNGDCLKNKITELYGVSGEPRTQDVRAYAAYYSSRAYSNGGQTLCKVELIIFIRSNGEFLIRSVSGMCAVY